MTEVDDKSEESSISIPDHIKDALGNPKELWKFVGESDEADSVIQPIAWELTSSIMAFLKDNGVSENLELYGKCLDQIACLSMPKDLYLGILEHFDPSAESRHVKLLLPALSVVLDKICKEDLEACIIVLETTFSTLSYYLESLNIPSYEEFEPLAKRQKPFEQKKIEYFIENYIAIIKPAVERIFGNNSKDSSNITRCKGYTFQFLCNLLVMLCQLDLAEPNTVKENGNRDDITKVEDDTALQESKQIPDIDQYTCSTTHVWCKVMEMLTEFYSPAFLWRTVNWFALYPTEERSEESVAEMEKHVVRARACFLFLLLSQAVTYELFPKVYANQSLLVYTVTCLNTLLSCKNQCVVWKGLEVLRYILCRVSDSSLSYQENLHGSARVYGNLQSTASQNLIFDIFQHLINAAILLPSKTIRTKSIQYVTALLDKFSWEDKYILLVRLLKTTEHVGARGVFIGFLKDKLSMILQVNPPKNSEVFSEPRKMSVLGEIIFTLPQGSETDLLHDCDRLMPALNLLRFIIIRDKSNKTGIFDHIDKIDKKFLKPLRVALDLSRAHYKNELMNHKKKAKQPLNDQTEFVVNGTPLPALGRKEQKETLEAALHTFDMIEVVVIRVIELIDSL